MRSEPCPFCEQNRPRIAANEYAFAISDSYPVSPGHSLIVSNRHVVSVLDLPNIEYAACFDLARAVCIILAKQNGASDFNIGANSGRFAGQTVPHAHIHVIPRYPGDVPDPRGGVRNVIPGKGPHVS
jgi:diadenosine tetraphosphate (Ap4A) HIT family hydrolase